MQSHLWYCDLSEFEFEIEIVIEIEKVWDFDFDPDFDFDETIYMRSSLIRCLGTLIFLKRHYTIYKWYRNQSQKNLRS